MLAEKAEWAVSFWDRTKGLLGKDSISPGTGLAIRPCRSVHMLGMRFAIDVVYVSRDSRVLTCMHELKPGKLGPVVRLAFWVLELPSGTIKATGTQVGDVLEVID
jgi:uncharacterized membrane protein (UPF0127 family)